MELGQMQILNEVVHNENSGDFSFDSDSICDSDYTQLVTPGTHVFVDSESDYISDEQQEIINVGLRGVSSKFAWKYIGSYPASREIFVMCMVPSLTLLK
jgi:hypothetical protein